MSDQGGGEFHKGLFYGVLLGIGLFWFLGTKEGKKIKDEMLSGGEDFLNKATKTIEATLEEKLDETEK